MPAWTIDRPQKLTIDEPVERLKVTLVVGRLNVVATDGPARVEISRMGRRPLVVESRDGTLSVRYVPHPRWPSLMWWLSLGQFGRRYRADVSIALPASADVDLRVIDGSVIVSGLRAKTFLDVTSGQVTMMGLSGRTSAKLVSGPVKAVGISGDLDLEAVSGELVIANSSPDRLRANTVSGGITCDLDNPARSEIRLGTTSGSVAVRVREDSDLSVRLHTTSGRITSAFDQVRPDTGSGWSKESSGVLGSGAGTLWASATSGSISLLASPAADGLPDEEADPRDEADAGEGVDLRKEAGADGERRAGEAGRTGEGEALA